MVTVPAVVPPNTAVAVPVVSVQFTSAEPLLEYHVPALAAHVPEPPPVTVAVPVGSQ